MPKDEFIVIAAGSDRVRQLVTGDMIFPGINDCVLLLKAAGFTYGVRQVTPNYFKKNLPFVLRNYKILFNVITDADMNAKVLAVLERILRANEISVINHPAKIRATTRDEIAVRLAGLEGVVAPKTLRLSGRNRQFSMESVSRSGLRFPGILRPIGTHSGEGVRIVRNMDDLSKHFVDQTEYYLTELADYKSEDGYYRKYRCFFIGDTIVFRHLIISDSWSIHARDRARLMIKHVWMINEEKEIHSIGSDYFSSKQIEALRRIRDCIGLDYSGVDFSISNSGDLLIFEANAAMNFFPFLDLDKFHHSRQCLPRAAYAMRRLIKSRLEGLPRAL